MISGAMRTASATRDYYKNHKERSDIKETISGKADAPHEISKANNRLEEQKEGISSRENDREQNSNSHYFEGARAEWQGKLAKERFPSGIFNYSDFVRVIDENDRFRTVELKFTVSKNAAAALTNSPDFKEVLKQSIGKAVEQIQADAKIKFRKLKSTKKSGLRVFKNKTGEIVVKVESHNIVKKNISAVKKLLENDKYQSAFRDEMAGNFEKMGIRAEAVHFRLDHFVRECTVAWDCVCQAPKSVSLTMMYPEHFEKILQGHEKATAAAMKFIEENYMVTRVRTDGINRRIVTHNMLAAGFTEFYNRDTQPHLHSHNVIFNTTRNPFFIKGRRSSKEYLAVLFKAIYDNYVIIDGVYKSRLAEELKKAGYEINHDKDNRLNFEIAGFSRDQLLHFSRVPTIDKKLENMGTNREQSSAKQRNAANLMTRKEKVHVDIDNWKEWVLREMEDMGIQSPTLIHEREAAPSLDLPAVDLKETLEKAADDFCYSHAAFTKRQFINGVLEQAGDVLTAQYIENYFDRSGRFINLGEHYGKTYFSTKENIDIEKGIYGYVETGKNKREEIIDEAKMNKALKFSNLDDDQEKAVRFITATPDRVVGIQGNPGVGKSFMLDKARTIFEKDNYKVTGLAPSNQAALTLKEKSGLQASTLHSFFIRLQEESGTWDKERNPLDLRQTDFSGLKPGSRKEAWFVDESSLIDNYCMNRLLEAAERKNAFVVLIGDKGQLPPVESGRPFFHMINGGRVSYVEVNDMKRQKESWQVFNAARLSTGQKNRVIALARTGKALVSFIDAPPFDSIPAERLEKVAVNRKLEIEVFKDRSVKEAVQHIVNGKVLDGLRLLTERTREIKDEDARFKAIADFYAGLSAKERAVTTIVTSVNRDREQINEVVRQRLKEKGELSGGRVFAVTGSKGRVQVKEFAQGDKIIFLRKANLSGQRVMKNDTGTILKIENKIKWGGKGYGFLQRRDYKRITVDLQGKRVVFNSDRYDFIDHIFCTTTYKVQSSSDKRIIAHFDTRQFNVNSVNDLLVKTSRSEAELIFFTNDAKSLYDAVKREYEKVGIADFSETDFTQHVVSGEKDGKAELLEKIADRFEYENAAFSQGDFVNGTPAIYEEMFESGETVLGLDESELRNYFEQKVNKGEYFEVGELKKVPYFSTEENIKIENRIYERAVDAKRAENRVPGFSFDRVQEYLDRSTLTGGQKEAMLFVTGSKHRLRAIQASPGTGVPFLLNVVRDFYEREGDYKVVALAPSNRAAQNLKEKAGFDNASTLHAHFIQLQKEAGTWEADRDPLDLRLTDFTGLSPGSHREIWFVDKASLIDNCAMYKLLEAAELKRAEVVLTGDVRQLQPVGAGKPFTNLVKTGKTGYVELDEIVRQKEVWQVYDSRKLSGSQRDKIVHRAFKQDALVSFFTGQPGDSIKPEQLEKLPVEPGLEVIIFRDTGLKEAVNRVVHDEIAAALDIVKSHISEVKDDETRLRRMAETYASLSHGEREQTFVITGTNRDRVKVNHLIREILKERGELGEGRVFTVRDNRGKEQEREFASGDRVVFLKKGEVSGHPVMKDDSGIVQKIEVKESETDTPEKRLVIDTKETALVIDPEDYNYIEHAYCSTAYKVQSAGDRTRVLAHFDTRQYNVNSSNDLLVKLSSAGREITIFTDDAKSLYDSVKREQDKVSIHDFLKDGTEINKSFVGVRGAILQKSPLAAGGDKQLLIDKISGKFEYRNAAFTRGEFVFGTMDIYSDLRSRGETESEINVADLKNYFDNRLKSGYFCEVGNLGQDTYFSTDRNINTENGIYERAAASQNRLTGFSESKVSRYLESTTLNAGQKDALLFLTTGKDRIRAIQGAPGVGKSFMLNVAKNFYEEEGYKVVALAPSNKAAANLKERAGFENAATIHSYLIRLQKEAGTWDSDRNPLDLRETDLNDLAPGNHREIWFVDEASLIDNPTMDRLLEAAEKKNAELPLIGDMNQLQPVGAGRPYTNMLKDNMIAHVEVSEILRQKEEWRVYHSGKLSAADKDDLVEQAKAIRSNAAVTFFKGPAPEDTVEKLEKLSTYRVESFKTVSGVEIDIHKDSSLKEAVKDAVDHNIYASLNRLGDRVVEIEDHVSRLREIASRFAGLSAHEREDTVIITATNKDRTAINDFARDLLKEKGELGKGSDFLVTDILGKKHVREFTTGDRVIFLKKEVFDDHLVNKDDVGVIKKIEGSRITITTGGKDIVIPADRYNHIDHAYCRTTYRVQGADYKTVFAHIDTRQSLVNSTNDFLVKISRATHKLELFTDDRYKLLDAVGKEQFKVSINDFKNEFYRKSEQQAISRLIEGLAKRDFENSRLPKKVVEDLQRGDAHYVRYLQLKQKASDTVSQADSLLKGRFHSDKARHEAEGKTLNYLEIGKKADEFRKKSEFYYKRALTNYAEVLTRQSEMKTGDKVHSVVFEQQFEKDYIPGGSIKSLGEFNLEKNAHSAELGNLAVPGMDYSFDYVEPELQGFGHEQDSPAFDSPGDAGDFPGVEGEDGGIHGPGISFDM